MTAIEKVTAMIAAANTATSAGDADLTDAVKSLIDGYGVSFWDNKGTLVRTQDVNGSVPSIPHNLNVSDNDVLILCLKGATNLRLSVQICRKSKFPNAGYAAGFNINGVAAQGFQCASIAEGNGGMNGTLYWQSANSCSIGRGTQGSQNQGTYEWFAKKLATEG